MLSADSNLSDKLLGLKLVFLATKSMLQEGAVIQLFIHATFSDHSLGLVSYYTRKLDNGS